ncbi:MAG: hypothetical protein NVS1B10_05750 [Candidatus Saccharimonadales bacterium]
MAMSCIEPSGHIPTRIGGTGVGDGMGALGVGSVVVGIAGGKNPSKGPSDGIDQSGSCVVLGKLEPDEPHAVAKVNINSAVRIPINCFILLSPKVLNSYSVCITVCTHSEYGVLQHFPDNC